jgi:hypothetical protein
MFRLILQHTKVLEAAAEGSPGSTPSSNSSGKKNKKRKKKSSPSTVESPASTPESVPGTRVDAPPLPAKALDYDAISREGWRVNLPKDQVTDVDVSSFRTCGKEHSCALIEHIPVLGIV